MWPVSDGFLRARLGGTRVKRVYLDANASGTWTEVKHSGFDLTASRGDGVVSRYSGSITLPPGCADMVDEHRSRVQVRAGFVVGGAEELVPVGTLTVDDVDETHRGDLVLTGYSDELRVERAQFRAPYIVEAGPAVLAIQALLAVVGATVVVRTTRDAQVPRTVYERGRWAALRDLAQAADVEVFVGPDGLWYIDDAPTIGAPVETITGTVGYRIRRTRRGVANVVVVEGDRAGLDTPPPRGEATDDNPYSSTYTGGPFGQVVDYVGNPLMTTDDMCRAAARTYLSKRVGRYRQVTVEAAPADYLTPGDCIAVTVGGSVETHIVDSIPHSSAGAQILATREVRG